MHSIIDKEQLRSTLRQYRRDLSFQEKNNAEKTIFDSIVTFPPYQKSHHLAFYLPHDNEVDLKLLLLKTVQRGENCYLPVLKSNRHLDFYSYRLDSQLIKNRFEIEETDVTQEKLIIPCALDLIFLPLVAFDQQGDRLGRGGGYYDRTLAFLKKRRANKPLLIGVAYEFQKLDDIPTEKLDIPLDFVVTEKNIYQFF